MRFFTALTLLLISTLSVAGNSLKPDRAFLAADKREATFTFTNNSNQPIDVTAELIPWYPQGDKPAESAAAAPQRDILVYPPVTRLGPNQSQVFRLIVRNPQLATPRYYRFNTAWRPAQQLGDGQHHIAINPAFSMPVFFLAAGATIDLTMKKLGQHDGQLVYLVSNQGDKPARVKAYRWHRNSAKTHLPFYVWPGQSRQVPVKPAPAGLATPRLEFEVEGYGFVKE